MIFSKVTFVAVLGALGASSTLADQAGCPFLKMQALLQKSENAPNSMQHPVRLHQSRRVNPNARSGDYGVPEGGYTAVREDIKAALVDSQDFFPADFESPIGPNYGGLMIRLAWHCSGSYRESDGRGGCDGGRIRFDPEINWPDNANLNNALKILEPIKEKYGSSLSWGDLIVLAGNTAIESMGGPIIGFCGGRVDDSDGANSLLLGPSDEQEALAPCQSIGMQGRCMSPLGPTTMGLIYVNPAGPINATGDPVASGEDIRNAFSRMGFDDRTSVALIGGGHAFGKAHGACSDPPCGEGDLQGIGNNTYTSGFEGAWTTTPTSWSNEYFFNLFTFNWTNITGPGGNLQWAPTDDGAPDIMMLTTDIAMIKDELYRSISEEYLSNITSLEEDFSRSWYRLTTSDMGPRARCIGDELPSFLLDHELDYDLGSAPETLPDFVPIYSKIVSLIEADPETNIPAFVKLAKGCAATFRETDYKGGCNGARVRFSPEIEWDYNAGANDTLKTLEEVKTAFPNASYADIIVLAGQAAIEKAGKVQLDFCGGRVDAQNANGSAILAPRAYDTAVITITDDMAVKGLTAQEGVALFAAPVKAGSTTLSNQYFIDLQAGNGNFTDEELALLEGEFASIVDEYASDNAAFLEQFSKAWTKMMTADRYDGPVKNACDGVSTKIRESQGDSSSAFTPVITSAIFNAVGAAASLLLLV